MNRPILIFPFMFLAACTAVPSGEDVSQLPFKPDYGRVVTKLLDNDLVSIAVEMRGARVGDDVIAFNDCAAAQYALIRGAGFVRRVRNDVKKTGKVWRGDGVYTLSDTIPGGIYTIDAEVAAENCAANNIPMV